MRKKVICISNSMEIKLAREIKVFLKKKKKGERNESIIQKNC